MYKATLAVTEYCERSGEGFWAEPVNALTNLGFILAAVIISQQLRRHRVAGQPQWDLWVLVVLMFTIGIGSFLWHTLVTAWAEWADVLPILLFINVFLLSFLYRIAQLRLRGMATVLLLFHTFNLSLYIFAPADGLNGSVFYIPTLLSLYLLWFFTWQKHHLAARRMLIASIIFTLAFTARSLDQIVCTRFPLGTHFIWHLLICLTIYQGTRALLPRK